MSELSIAQLGPYQITKLLGRGGMGAVFLGIHEVTGQPAAVKVLSPTLADDPGFKARFTGEIESLKQLRHPHIVELYGYGEDEGKLFYAMEYVPGLTLQQELKAGRRFHWREVARLGIDICKALKHAHDVGVIHRDLKPANLLFGKDEVVKLTDFGIAKLFGYERLTTVGDVMGTADYMAPEQAEGKPATPRCDLFALGSVLYALLAGKPPFYAKTLAEVLHHLRFDDPTPVSRRNQEVPEEFDQFILQLLNKDPAQRIPTARAAWKRLEAMVDALSLAAEEGGASANGEDSTGDQRPPAVTGPPSIATRDTASPAGDHSRQPIAAAPSEPPDEDEHLGGIDSTGPPMRDGAQSAAAMDDAPPDRDTNDWSTGDGAQPASEPDQQRPRRRFITLSEAEAAKRKRKMDLLGIVRVLLFAAAVAALGAAIWCLTRPPSAEELFARIAAAREADEEDLRAAETDARRFLELYAEDARAAEVEQTLAEIELLRLERRYQWRARLKTGREELTLVERDYVDALALADIQPHLARERLAAIVDVYADAAADKETRQVIELARRRLDQYQAEEEKYLQSHRTGLQRRLAAADELVAADPERAIEIWRGVITLYAHRAWAKPYVEQAERRLAEVEEN